MIIRFHDPTLCFTWESKHRNPTDLVYSIHETLSFTRYTKFSSIHTAELETALQCIQQIFRNLASSKLILSDSLPILLAISNFQSYHMLILLPFIHLQASNIHPINETVENTVNWRIHYLFTLLMSSSAIVPSVTLQIFLNEKRLYFFILNVLVQFWKIENKEIQLVNNAYLILWKWCGMSHVYSWVFNM